MDERMKEQGARLQFRQPTGLMFHHFHGSGHPEVQGSISADEFEEIISAVGRERVVSADEWMNRATAGKLRADDTCITFDDALLCQYDVAKPVLDRFGITAFWFIYTSVFEGVAEKLEIYRFFRCTAFSSIDEFYDKFFATAETKLSQVYSEHKSNFDPTAYLPNSPFYTDNDRWFRYLRDQVLGPSEYFSIMEDIIDDLGFDRQAAAKRLWLDSDHVKALAEDGHVIGLHSHTHPTNMAALSHDAQSEEYYTNKEFIAKLAGYSPTTASHPCNSYDENTLSILKALDVKLAFRADTAPVERRTSLEFPREDHANILKALRQSAPASL